MFSLNTRRSTLDPVFVLRGKDGVKIWGGENPERTFMDDITVLTYSSLNQTSSTPEYDETNVVTINITEPTNASGIDTVLLYYRIDNGSWVENNVSSTHNYTFTADDLWYDQFYEWYFWFNDTSGNNTQTPFQSFTVSDSTVPSYSNLNQTSSTPEYNESNTVSVTITEPIDASGIDSVLLHYTTNNWITDTIIDVTSSQTFVFTAKMLSYGQKYEWYFWFNDTAGNSAQTPLQSFSVIDTFEPDIITLARSYTSTPPTSPTTTAPITSTPPASSTTSSTITPSPTNSSPINGSPSIDGMNLSTFIILDILALTGGVILALELEKYRKPKVK